MSDGMLIGAGVVLIYTLFGGMWSVALTTFVQMIVIVIGLLLVASNAADHQAVLRVLLLRPVRKENLISYQAWTQLICSAGLQPCSRLH